jgi:hypothetical protein
VVLGLDDKDVCKAGTYGPGKNCRAGDNLCATQIWMMSISFTLIFSPMFAKLYR